jgi:hypothetical protein
MATDTNEYEMFFRSNTNDNLNRYPNRSQELRANYFFCPFVPLLTTPVVLDPDSFRQSPAMRRYSEEDLRQGAAYYSRLVINGLDYSDNEEATIELTARYSGRPYRRRIEIPKVNWRQEGF